MLALDNKVMRFFKIFFVALVATVAMTGCDSPEYPDPAGERGTLSFDGFVLTAVDKTLASPVEIEVADFVVNVRNSSTGDVVASWTYGEIPASVELLDGSYVVEAYNAELQPAAWDAPYYYASAQVRVYGKEETSMSAMQCTLANVAVSVEYSDAFSAVMGSDVAVRVEMAQGSAMDFTPGETRRAYFSPGATTLVAVLTGTVGGMDTMMQQVITGIEPGQHYQVTFSLDDEQ